MTRTIVDISVLQTVPPSNINRDDTGSPKTAVYGGVRRARVSSQAWKRAARLDFSERLDTSDLGTRTKRVAELLADAITKRNPAVDADRAQELAELVFKAAGIKLTAPRKSKDEESLPPEAGYLLFLSARQIERLAEVAVDAEASEDAAASIKAAKVKTLLDLEHSVDISLFGRMVAEATDLNVDAAAQVAHALSIHPVENEFDYYTAVDDHKSADDEEDAGAGMIGTVEFNSSTLYRYATVDVDALRRNLGDASDGASATQRAVEAFVESFVRSLPSGKQNTFANRTLPDAVVISVRDSQPVNLVGAFEEPVAGTHRIAEGARRLAEYAQSVDGAYGTAPVSGWVVRVSDAAAPLDSLGERVGLDDAVAQLGRAVAERLTDTP
ncbi:type I-E CRISPR-associated protein Cas7/Cse4/CasC [Microbacterium halotolerans]|uniref:type I-E CRISPR-associated protein Cas7/Cse4/CasC n=1 Tax=Microbacterium halotolerans TaxID=246613 RepID=UPI000E6ACCA3|nr:type I-E CRISPR-associated protein Cas7/Cse4/CasC [Microbacterium halotolerans]